MTYEEIAKTVKSVMTASGLEIREPWNIPSVIVDPTLAEAGVVHGATVKRVYVKDTNDANSLAHEMCHYYDPTERDSSVGYYFRQTEVTARFVAWCVESGFTPQAGDHLRWRDDQMGFGYKPSRSPRKRINAFAKKYPLGGDKINGWHPTAGGRYAGKMERGIWRKSFRV